MQIIIFLCLCIWSVLQPTTDLPLIVFIGLVIAISSSTQDITIDALELNKWKSTKQNQLRQQLIAVIGWWTGYKLLVCFIHS